jgi:hypothetical protein
MRRSIIGFMVLLAANALAAQQAQAPKRTAQASQQLPPLSYVCPMVQDAEVIENKPGNCPKCKMALVPVRLDSKYSCPVHQAVVRDTPGTCPLDKRELVRLTLSVFWTCAGEPDKKLLEPGKCANGQARNIQYEPRPHGDHNPKHGGQFFMASDNWHHLEGTYPQAGLFRMHFYDDYTKPIAVKGFSGTLVLLDANDKEIASVPLATARGGRTMEAPIKNAALPLKVAAKVRFEQTGPENRFDFTFAEYSKEPPPPKPGSMPAATTAGGAATPAGTTPNAAGAAASATAPKAANQEGGQPGSVPPAQGGPATPGAPSTTPGLPDNSNVPAALAAALDETGLPNSTPDLVKELEKRSQEVDSLIKDGSLGQIWLPAMATKTVALALESHAAALPERQRAAAAAAVKRVVTATWELDAYGDLGNKQKIADAYGRLASAISALKAIYASPR